MRSTLSNANHYFGIYLLTELRSCVDVEGREENFKFGADLRQIESHSLTERFCRRLGNKKEILQMGYDIGDSCRWNMMGAQINYTVCILEDLGVSVDSVSAARY